MLKLPRQRTDISVNEINHLIIHRFTNEDHFHNFDKFLQILPILMNEPINMRWRTLTMTIREVWSQHLLIFNENWSWMWPLEPLLFTMDYCLYKLNSLLLFQSVSVVHALLVVFFLNICCENRKSQRQYCSFICKVMD